MDPTGDISAAASPPTNLPGAALAPDSRAASPALVAKDDPQGNAPELPCPALRRPDLVGVFDASAHSAADFDFSAASVVFGAATRKTFKIRAKRVKNRHARRDPVREASALITGLTNQTQLEAFQLASRMVSVHRSPRKRAMLESPKVEDNEVAEFEEFHEDLDLDLWDAKAAIRDHLLQASPVHTAATKRLINGHERNWIRAHKTDPDVQYLLQFPGNMPAEKARDLVYRRDMLALSVVEEDCDGSIVMEMFIASTAEHTSEASRLEKLDKAAAMPHPVADRIDEEEACDSTMPNCDEETEAQQDTQAGPEAVEETQITQPIHEPVNEETPVTEAVPEPTEEAQIAEPVFEPIEEVQVTPIGPAPATETTPTIQVSHEETPQTPSRENEHDIVDVDLHTQSDIFASVMPKRHQEMNPTIPAQPAWTTATTPRPESSPVGAFEVDEDISAHWSPLAATPGTQLAATTTPRPQSSPVGTFEVDHDTSAHWSPIARTPAPIQQTAATTPRPESSPVGAFEIDQDMSAHWSPIAPTPSATRRTGEAPQTPTAQEHNPCSQPATVPSGGSAQRGQQFLVRFRGSMGPEDIMKDNASHAEDDVQFTFQVDEVNDPTEAEAQQVEQQDAHNRQQETPIQNEDRNYLLRFMIKHQAGKSKGAVSPAPGSAAAGPRTPDHIGLQHANIPASTPIQPPVNSTSTPLQHAVMSAHKPKAAGTPIRAVSRIPEQVETPVRASVSRSRAGRTPLGQLDTNSPSPVKARAGKRKLDDGPGDEELPENRPAEGEGEKAAEPSPKRRRGLRDRKPVAPPTPLPVNARAVRNGEKDLASLTRANTRANKGNAAWPEEVLERFAADPMGQKWKERKEVVDAKAARAASATSKAGGRNVRWAETLAQYSEAAPVVEDDDEDEIAGAQADEKDDVFGDKTEDKSETKSEVATKDEPKESPKPKPRRGRPPRAAATAAAVPAIAATTVSANVAPPAVKTAPKAAPKTAPKSKLPAPVSRTRATKSTKTIATTAAPKPTRAVAKPVTAIKAPAKIPKVEDDKVVKRRSTRTAAQQSNVSMGLTATGTPIRRGRGRPKAS
ncbi:hypothetical protein F5X68DRAFT_31766 [Plectosphaerella plurivora]|uniref:Uncharacterized protein n=1 Tax=Plectosphaerella plurivora TaxID=936078 RepID=A0A9P9AHR8_9PEZI|nr:hypothetical protein F5X68DRAFT_31766 [Plectosphaerella plurivora]